MNMFGTAPAAWLRRLRRDRRGATAVEYGLLAGLIAVAIMATVFAMGAGIRATLYEAITNALASMV